MNLHTRILRVRKNAGIRQEEMSRIVGVSNASISVWETGINVPLLKNLKKFATATFQDLNWLQTGKGTCNVGWYAINYNNTGWGGKPSLGKSATIPDTYTFFEDDEPETQPAIHVKRKPYIHIPEYVFTQLESLATSCCSQRESGIADEHDARDTLEAFFHAQIKRAFTLGMQEGREDGQ